ncbi:MAG: T9SS type A sorting domain-containing protein, partial [Paludibacter sp.]
RTVSSIELQTRFAAIGNYSISIRNTDKVNNYAAIILYDKVTGRSTDLLSTGTYTYTTNTTGTTSRFSVQFAPKITTGVSVSTDGKIKISSTANNAIITGLSASAQIAVYDTNGKSAFMGTISNGQAVSLNKGLYIFEITTPDKTTRIKSFIR